MEKKNTSFTTKPSFPASLLAHPAEMLGCCPPAQVSFQGRVDCLSSSRKSVRMAPTWPSCSACPSLRGGSSASACWTRCSTRWGGLWGHGCLLAHTGVDISSPPAVVCQGLHDHHHPAAAGPRHYTRLWLPLCGRCCCRACAWGLWDVRLSERGKMEQNGENIALCIIHGQPQHCQEH